MLICLPLQFALPYLRKTKGNIINMSSLVAQIGQPGAVAYVASKVNFLSTAKWYTHNHLTMLSLDEMVEAGVMEGRSCSKGLIR